MSALAGEAVGSAYRRDALLFAQQQTWRAVQAIGERVAPGVRESELRRIASEVLSSLGAERRWHPDIIRIGANTAPAAASCMPSRSAKPRQWAGP